MKKEKTKTNKSKVSVELNIECMIEADTLLEAVKVLKEKYNIDVEAEDVAARIECMTNNDVFPNRADTKLSDGDILKVTIAPIKCMHFDPREETPEEVSEEDPSTKAQQEAKASDIANRIENLLGQIKELEQKWGGKRNFHRNDGCVECGRGCNRPFGGQGYTTIIGGTGPDMIDMLRHLRDAGELF